MKSYRIGGPLLASHDGQAVSATRPQKPLSSYLFPLTKLARFYNQVDVNLVGVNYSPHGIFSSSE